MRKEGHVLGARWGLAGFYLSIIKLGTFAPGDPVALLTDVA